MARYASRMTTPTNDQLARLGATFEAFSRRYKMTESIGAEKPLNELDKQALFFVGRNPECGPTDLARFLAVPTTTISSATDRLAKRGLLDRHRLESDRRAVALRLTAGGQAQVDQLGAAYQDLYRHMLAPLAKSERDTLIFLLEKIISSED